MTVRRLYASTWVTWLVFAGVAALTLSYYNWQARATGEPYHWRRQDLPRYYAYLGRAFAHGQLHLPIEPAAELLALRDPWDPTLNDRWRLHDAVLYKGRYYLYHGAGPAVVLFTPWRLMTGYDMPEQFAVMLLCFAAYLFLSRCLIRLLKQVDSLPGPFLLTLMLVVLAVGTGVPYLLTRVWVYEVAIAGAYFGVAGAVYFLVRGLQEQGVVSFLLSGLLLGVAISSRPHVGIAGGVCSMTVVLCHRRWKGAVALALPLLFSGMAVLAYNYARFDDALEFGTHYQLAGDRSQQHLNPSLANWYPGVYYMMFCPPGMSAVFTFVRIVSRIPPVTNSLPSNYFFEPTVGAMFISPVLIALLLLPLIRHQRSAAVVACGAVGAALAALLFVVTIGLTTQRYQVDFVPLLVFAALVCIGVTARQARGAIRGLTVAVTIALSSWTIFANAALGITGPYDEVLQRRPKTWIRIAQWFSFSEAHKPLLNPRVTVAAQLTFQKNPSGFREPLFVLGQDAYRWMLYAEHAKSGVRLVSASPTSSAQPEQLLQPGVQYEITAEYHPDSRLMTTRIDDAAQIDHPLENLVLARSQVRLGRNDVVPFLTYPEFTGKLRIDKVIFDGTVSER